MKISAIPEEHGCNIPPQLRITGLILLLAIFLCTTAANGQNKATLYVLDADDDSPLIGATLIPSLEQKKNLGWITDLQGKAVLDLTEPTTVRISYVGYLSSEQELMPGQTIEIRLEQDLLKLEEIVVTGSFIPTVSSKSLYKVKTLDADLIESRGAVNLGDLLQTQLNLKTIQDDVLGTRVVMQGISGPNVKMLMDGVPLVNGSGGEFDLSQINMNNVERVEVVEGPLSVQYGTNALAGTINVISKNYKMNELQLNATAYAESVGQYNVDLGVARGWEKLSLSVGGARNQFEGFSSTNERKKNWIPRTQYLLNAKVKARLRALNITASYNQMWQNSTSHGNATSAFNNRTNRISNIAADNYFNTNRLDGALVMDGRLANKHYINIVNGVSRFEQAGRKFLQDVEDDIRWKSSNVADHDTTSFTTMTFRGTYVYGNSLENRGAYLTLGYEVAVNKASGGRVSSDARNSFSDLGLFVAVEVPIASQLKIQPAVRYVYSTSYNARDIDFLSANLPILPSLNIMFRAKEKFDFRISYGKGYRTPSVRELYYEFIDANHYIVGNVDLQPELGNNYNGSMTWRTKIAGASAALTPSVFFSQINNKIDLIQIADRNTLPDEVPKNVPVARVYENIPNFKSYGFNFSGEVVWPNDLKLSPGLGVLARSGSEADDRFYDSYEANLNASYRIKKWDSQINLFYKYNGRISEFARNQDGSIGVLTLEDYHTLDLSISGPVYKNRLFATIGAKNVFDVADIALVGEGSKGLVLQTGREAFYPISWGRTFFISLNYNFKQKTVDQ